MFFIKKKNTIFYTCDVGILTTNINKNNYLKSANFLLEKANEANINILGIGGIGQINVNAFLSVTKNHHIKIFPNVIKIYPTIICLFDNIIKPGKIITKFILNTVNSKILKAIDNYLKNLYITNNLSANEYLFDNETLHDFLMFINHKHNLQLEIWAFYDNQRLTCQLEPNDIIKIPASFLGHCFHKHVRSKITLGSNCENWNFYPENSANDALNNSIYKNKFYYLSPTNDLFI